MTINFPQAAPAAEEPGEPTGSNDTTAGIERLNALIAEEERSAGRIMEDPVRGPRKQQMTLAGAVVKEAELANRIELEEGRGSQRHRIVGRVTKIVSLVFLVVIDFPLMLWLASSLFNVDWSDPIGLPLAVSLVVSLLGTAGAAWMLHLLGRNRREDKNDRRQMEWSAMSVGAKASLLAVGLLIVLIAAVMFERVYAEAVFSGLEGLALLMAVLIAFIMLLAAALVFGTAFRDGSPEQDDLAHYSELVQAGRQRRREHEDRAAQLRHERDMLIRRMAAG
jgi:hypothetical protein